MKIKEFLLLIITSSILFNCNSHKNYIKPAVQKELPSPNFKFYLDNSMSMDGFLDGGSDFRALISNLLVNFKDLDSSRSEPQLFYINTSAQRVSRTSTEFFRSFPDYKSGERGNSKLDDIFKIILNGIDSNTVSALVTDGIYSMDATNTNNVKNNLVTAQAATNDILRAVKNSKSYISICVVKASSTFNGTYYSEEGGKDFNKSITNKNRPYYLWLFGNTYYLDEILARIKTNQFSNAGVDTSSIAWFTRNENDSIKSQISYTNKLGEYKVEKESTLANAKKDKNGLLQFSVLVDFSDVRASDQYIKDTSNYYCEPPYSIVKIDKDISNPNFTHLITISTKTVETGKLIISLKNKLPAWVLSSSTDHDSNINAPDQINKTFGLKYLLEAVQNTYGGRKEEVNLASFNINIDANKSSPYKRIGIVLFVALLLGLILYFKNKR